MLEVAMVVAEVEIEAVVTPKPKKIQDSPLN